MQTNRMIVVVLAAVVCVGCGSPASTTPTPAPVAAPSPTPHDASAVATPVETETPSTATDAPQDVERVTADVGVGQKGRSLDEYSGPIVTPAKAYFNVREKVVFQIQIPQALQFFEANEGRPPQSQEEFMEKVIAANQIKLPELPPGQKYVYDVEKKELMVERPRN